MVILFSISEAMASSKEECERQGKHWNGYLNICYKTRGERGNGPDNKEACERAGKHWNGYLNICYKTRGERGNGPDNKEACERAGKHWNGYLNICYKTRGIRIVPRAKTKEQCEADGFNWNEVLNVCELPRGGSSGQRPKNRQDCEKQGMYWNNYLNVCYKSRGEYDGKRPTTKKECKKAGRHWNGYLNICYATRGESDADRPRNRKECERRGLFWNGYLNVCYASRGASEAHQKEAGAELGGELPIGVGQCSSDGSGEQKPVAKSSIMVSFDYEAQPSRTLPSSGLDAKKQQAINQALYGIGADNTKRISDRSLMSERCGQNWGEASSMYDQLLSEDDLDEQDRIRHQLGEMCQKSAKKAFFDIIARYTKEEPSYTFNYSGHGSIVEGKWGMLIPDPLMPPELVDQQIIQGENVDRYYAGQDELKAAIKPKAAIIDGCHSASMGKAFLEDNPDGQPFMISAAMGNQLALEFDDGGLLTTTLLNMLNGENQRMCNVDLNKDGKIDQRELMTTMSLNMHMHANPKILFNLIEQKPLNFSAIKQDVMQSPDVVLGSQQPFAKATGQCMFALPEGLNCPRVDYPCLASEVCADQCEDQMKEAQEVIKSLEHISGNIMDINFLPRLENLEKPEPVSDDPYHQSNILLQKQTRKNAVSFLQDWAAEIDSQMRECAKDNERCREAMEISTAANKLLGSLEEVMTIFAPQFRGDSAETVPGEVRRRK